MTKTELKYWQNGYSKRGKNFKQLAFKIGSIGIIITNFKYPLITLYKLTK